MSVVKINVLTVPAERREVLEQRFGARAGEVDTTPGFESFQLLRPTDDSDRYFVVTQWESEEAFEAWMSSRAFQRGHGTQSGESSESPEAPGNADGGEARGSDSGSRPAASGAELLSFEVIQSSVAAG
ncbi:MAG TPA: antibiotic biosynthesis monooxygenase [Nitriliruptoraceae bacterium]|nr:antibiotic biosynthesis monooxygenase [Nitriliruptoraceae bacterium]